MEAYLFLREKNQSIPSDTLELMKDAALERLVSKNESIGHVIDRREQLKIIDKLNELSNELTRNIGKL